MSGISALITRTISAEGTTSFMRQPLEEPTSMNDVDFPVADVLKGIEAAHDAGFAPIKINMVVRQGVNDHDIVAMARRFKGSGHIVRFI